MIDIVIPLGSGSAWENNELRYALRSVEMYVKNYRDIYIIGERPIWAKNIKYLPFKETGHVSQNIMNKVYSLCRVAALSENFLFTNDDIFFTRPVDATNYPYYHRGDLQDVVGINKNNWYQDYIIETIKELNAHRSSTLNFDGHCPIIYNKHRFKALAQSFDWNKRLVLKSMYCNTFNIKGQYMTDCKVKNWLSYEQIQSLIQGRHLFSIGDRCLLDTHNQKSPMKALLKELYPNPSKYELQFIPSCQA